MIKKEETILFGLERFIYYIVKESRNWTNDFRNWNPLMKLKHYLEFANFVNKEAKLNMSSMEITEQVLLALDSEWLKTWEQYYEFNKWPYELEGEVNLDTQHVTIYEEIENETMNILDHERHPELSEYEKELVDATQDDYLEFTLSNEYDEAQLESASIPSVIRMPEEDRYVQFLNEGFDSGLKVDMVDNEEYAKLSNAQISKDMHSLFNKMIKSYELPDTYYKYLEQKDIAIIIKDKEKETEQCLKK